MPKVAFPIAILAPLVGLSFLLVETAISPALACCHGSGATATRRGSSRVPVPTMVPTPAPVRTPVVQPPVVRLPPIPVMPGLPPGIDAAVRAATAQGGPPRGIEQSGVWPGLPPGVGSAVAEAMGAPPPPPKWVPSDQDLADFVKWTDRELWHNEYGLRQAREQHIRGTFIRYIGGAAISIFGGMAVGFTWAVSETMGETVGTNIKEGKDLTTGLGDAGIAETGGQLFEIAVESTTGIPVPGSGTLIKNEIQQVLNREQARGPAPPAASNEDMQAMMFGAPATGSSTGPATATPVAQ